MRKTKAEGDDKPAAKLKATFTYDDAAEQYRLVKLTGHCWINLGSDGVFVGRSYDEKTIDKIIEAGVFVTIYDAGSWSSYDPKE